MGSNGSIGGRQRSFPNHPYQVRGCSCPACLVVIHACGIGILLGPCFAELSFVKAEIEGLWHVLVAP